MAEPLLELEPDYIPAPEAAFRIGISYGRFRRLIEQGGIPIVNVATNSDGKRPHWMVAKTDLVAFLESRQWQATGTRAKKIAWNQLQTQRSR
jgi:hypothetical protein